MNRKSRILFIVGIFCVGIFLYISRIAFAHTNIIDEAVNNLNVFYPTASETPIPGGPGFISINSYAFQPYFPSDLYTRYGQLLSCGQAECLFSAGINLPQGATITKLVTYYYDNSEINLDVNLKRGWLIAEFPSIMANVASVGTGIINRTSETTTIVDPIIDNQTYSYYVEAWFHGNDPQIRLIGIRIDYAYPSQLPLVIK